MEQAPPIPAEVARQICERIQSEKSNRLFTQCWGCVRFSKGDFSKMCVSGSPDHRGCKLVNDAFDKMS